MDVSPNNHFLCKGFQLPYWNNHLFLVVWGSRFSTPNGETSKRLQTSNLARRSKSASASRAGLGALKMRLPGLQLRELRQPPRGHPPARRCSGRAVPSSERKGCSAQLGPEVTGGVSRWRCAFTHFTSQGPTPRVRRRGYRNRHPEIRRGPWYGEVWNVRPFCRSFRPECPPSRRSGRFDPKGSDEGVETEEDLEAYELNERDVCIEQDVENAWKHDKTGCYSSCWRLAEHSSQHANNQH